MGGGIAVAEQLPAGPAAELMSIVKSSFIDGLSRGSLVSAIVVAVGAIVALRFLPARAQKVPSVRA
jgi:hypothetical protein